MTNVLTKLKKLFPLSFMFSQNVWKLLLGAVIYLGINEVAITVLSGILTFAMIPVVIAMIPVYGWILGIIFFPIVLICFVLTLALTFAINIVSLYVQFGIIVSIIAHVTAEDEPVVVAEVEAPVAEIAE